MSDSNSKNQFSPNSKTLALISVNKRCQNESESTISGSQDLYSTEGYALMGACFEVHREQGGGLLEEIYQESLELELTACNIPFESKAQLKLSYKGQELKKRYTPDLLVHEGIVVELKSVSKLTSEHEAQLINYMRITKQPVGYLINFGPIGKLEWKRMVLSEFKKH